MRSRLSAVIVLLVVSVAAVYAAKPAGVQYSAKLSGANQVPPIRSKARGSATFVVSPDSMSISYTIRTRGLKDVTAAHIHLGAAGKNGDVVVVLYPSTAAPKAGILARGVITSADLVGPMMNKTLSDLLDAMNSGDTYVNVHTKAHPDGKIRGQIVLKH